jgi:hypothetical protein
MAKKKEKPEKQISFYCTKEFSELVHAEKVRRGLGIQEMIIKALSEYFSRPTAEDLRSTRDQEEEIAERLDRGERVKFGELPEPFHVHRWIDLCVKYYQRMPKVKVRVLEEFILLDLKNYGSSRLKQKD